MTYFLTLARQVKKQSAVTVIAVGSLALGFSTCLLIGLYLDYHIGFDQCHTGIQNIYRVIRGARKNAEVTYGERTSGGLALVLKTELPEVLETVRIHRWIRDVRTEQKEIADLRFCMADPQIFSVFDLAMQSGDGMAVLGDPSSILLTERLAKTLFGPVDALGKAIRVGDVDYRIGGILRDIPAQSSLQFDMLAAPQSNWSERWQTWDEKRNKPVEVFVLLRDDADPYQLEQKMQGLVAHRFGKEVERTVEYRLQALDRIHLYSNRDFGIRTEKHGVPPQVHAKARDLLLLGVLGALAMLICCANYVSLWTARMGRRAREVGMRKVLGASRAAVARQLVAESVVLALGGMAVAICLAQVALPYFSELSGAHVSLAERGVPIAATSIVVACLVGVLSGLYPSVWLSSVQPALAFKGTGRQTRPRKLSKGLVVAQFAIATPVAVLTWGIYSQYDYMRFKDLGFANRNVVVVPVFGAANGNPEIDAWRFKQRYPEVKAAFLAHPNINEATTSLKPFGTDASIQTFQPEGLGTQHVDMFRVDEDFLDFYGLRVMEGRNFPENYARTNNVQRRNEGLEELLILNETAARQWGLGVGSRLTWVVGGDFFPGGRRDGRVIGIVADFHFRSLHNAIGPLVLVTEPHSMVNLYLRIGDGDVKDTLSFMQKVWERFIPNRTFGFSFLESNLQSLYESEIKLGRLFMVITSLSMAVACLGLVGLALMEVESRTKELGVRKVLGATTIGLFSLMNRDIIACVGFAYVLGCPIAFLVLARWLEGFAYRIEPGAPLFLIVGLTFLGIAILTVSTQTLRAARRDPVEVMRYE